jgi:hypothetical protein
MFALKLILGHFIGDYMLQNDFMALNKVRPDLKGYGACFLHCLVYSLCVACLVGSGHLIPSLILLIFITHFPIDKVSFGKWWLSHVLKKNPPTLTDDQVLGQHATPAVNSIRLFYYHFVYVAVDNTFHFILMVAGIWFFFPNLM